MNVISCKFAHHQVLRQWYLFRTPENAVELQAVAQLVNAKQLAMQIPCWHNVVIISKIKNHEEALFYVQKMIDNNWSRAVLTHQIEGNLFRREGKALTNFSASLPAPQSDLARQTLKDPYIFDFLTMREKNDERELEDALVGDEIFFTDCGGDRSGVGRWGMSLPIIIKLKNLDPFHTVQTLLLDHHQMKPKLPGEHLNP